MEPILCVGIDPAPSARGSAVVEFEVDSNGIHFAGEKMRPIVKHSELRKYLTELRKKSRVLLAWDAPLTGPSHLDSECTCANGKHGAGCEYQSGDFTQRQIEKDFSGKPQAKISVFRPQPGISVQGYAECQHWTLTRHLLGLPRVGQYDTCWSKLPFELLSSNEWQPRLSEKWGTRPKVVEVHPALAVWVWLHDLLPVIPKWTYKSKKNGVSKEERQNIRREFLQHLMKIWKERRVPDLTQTDQNRMINSPDLFDAYVSAVLAALWVKEKLQRTDEPHVVLYGDINKGSFLLPSNPEIEKSVRA